MGILYSFLAEFFVFLDILDKSLFTTRHSTFKLPLPVDGPLTKWFDVSVSCRLLSSSVVRSAKFRLFYSIFSSFWAFLNGTLGIFEGKISLFDSSCLVIAPR